MVGNAPVAARIVGRYAIFDEIAAGGMATVYLGRLMGSGGFARTVAIKSMHPQFAKDPEFVSMFLDEARIVARIRHPNVVPTLDVVASRGEVFLVMDYVQGETLNHLAKRILARGERIPTPVLLRVMSDILQGLHAAHEARDEHGVPLGIVHRDVSPHNILVGIDGVARLLDFGVAKAAGRAQTTGEGQIKGKLAYMAPEQLTGSGVSRQTDIYAASVVFWEAITGSRLFTPDNNLDLHARVNHREIRRPSELVPDVPAELEAVLMRGLAPAVEDRFATAREMCAALGRCGLAEAPAVVVGEWVENLAAEVLADRTAKIAAIASSSGTLEMPISAPPSGPPSTPEPVGGFGTSQVDALTVTLDAGVLRRGRRRRLWTLAGVLAAALFGGGFALFKSVPREPPRQALARPSTPSTGVAWAPASVSDQTDPTPSPSPTEVAAVAPPASTAAPPPAARPAASRRPPVSLKPRSDSDLFESRE
jgi:serine/threonine-protein kinase